ncbi:MAG: methyltransferase domain-containing protein [Alphaproteobacteria bacterium]
MWNDVVDLAAFYASPPGQVARRMIRRRVRAMWPDVGSQRVLGLGYATPLLRPFLDEAERVLAVMPARQGMHPWPRGEPNRVTLADEAQLPLPDRSVDRLLLVHALECTEQLRPMMRELWRVLDDAGRLLIVTPNRRGIWARLERTPFGHGRPYTVGQLNRVLAETLFSPTRTERALFLPPTRSRMLLRAAPAWEKVGLRWFPQFCGVLLMEARKDAYAPTVAGEKARARSFALSPQAMAMPMRRGSCLRRNDVE